MEGNELQETELHEIRIGETIVNAYVIPTGGEEEVSIGIMSFDAVKEEIIVVCKSINDIFENVKPQKATVEFSVELGIKEGKLTALLFSGNTKAGLKMTLEWGANKL